MELVGTSDSGVGVNGRQQDWDRRSWNSRHTR